MNYIKSKRTFFLPSIISSHLVCTLKLSGKGERLNFLKLLFNWGAFLRDCALSGPELSRETELFWQRLT